MVTCPQAGVTGCPAALYPPEHFRNRTPGNPCTPGAPGTSRTPKTPRIHAWRARRAQANPLLHREVAESKRPATAYTDGMPDVTQILCAIEQGDPAAVEQLLPLVYDELRRLA